MIHPATDSEFCVAAARLPGNRIAAVNILFTGTARLCVGRWDDMIGHDQEY